VIAPAVVGRELKVQKLTQRQEMVLQYIQSSITERGYPPTLREIGNFMGIRSTNGVNDHLRALERKGYLTREDMKSRALRPTMLDHTENGTNGHGAKHGANGVNGANGKTNGHALSGDLIEIPILGRVAAGQLTEALENPEDSVTIDRVLIGGAGHEVFGLRVSGQSMIKAGIHNGDYVFVKKQLDAHKGEIIVAMVGDEATCKYYHPEPDRVRLVPANDEMDDIVISKNDWRSTQILGVVVGVYRKLN
jgi:repressor LexA